MQRRQDNRRIHNTRMHRLLQRLRPSSTTTTSATPLSASERKFNFMLEVMSYGDKDESELREDSSANKFTTAESACTSTSSE